MLIILSIVYVIVDALLS
ncbi:hypothetical protein [Streptococcus pneumoniae]